MEWHRLDNRKPYDSTRGDVNKIPLGIFSSPLPTLDAYKECAEAGFNFVLVDQNYAAIGSTSYKSIMEFCIQAGMKPLAMTFGTNDLTDFSSMDGFGGKFFFDEPSADKFATIAQYIAQFELMNGTERIFLNNLFPYYAGTSALGCNTYEEYLERYTTEVLSQLNGPKWLSVDFYPLLAKSDGSTILHKGYLYNLEATAQVMRNHRDLDLTVHYFVQTHGHGSGTWNPRDLQSVADIRYQYNCAMAYGVNAFSAFTYPTQAGDDFKNGQGLVTNNPDGTTTKNPAYYYVQKANQELLAWDDIYLSYDYEGTKAVAVSARGQECVSQLKHNMETLSGVSVSATNDTLVGQFDKNGAKAFMVTNFVDPSLAQSDVVTLTFSAGNTADVYINGVLIQYALTDGQLQLTLGAGEAAFVIVK